MVAFSRNRIASQLRHCARACIEERDLEQEIDQRTTFARTNSREDQDKQYKIKLSIEGNVERLIGQYRCETDPPTIFFHF